MQVGFTVRTVQELEEAQKKGVAEIHIEGELAQHVKSGSGIRKLGYIALGILGAALVAAPFTGTLVAIMCWQAKRLAKISNLNLFIFEFF